APADVSSGSIDGVRRFIAEENRLENRAIYNGDESDQQVDAVLRYFAARESNLVIEVNPANYYVNPPVTWEKRLLKHLLRRGCWIDGFRCVWVRGHALSADEVTSTKRIERFRPEQIEPFIELARRADP